VIKEIIKTM